MKLFWAPILQKGICLFRKRKNLLKNVSLFIFLFLSITIIASCGGKQQVKVSLESSKYLNLDDAGYPLPVIVRVYLLKGKDSMEKADFVSLWKSEQDILGEDLVDRKEITLLPDSSIDMQLEIDPEKGVKYIGIMALFRKPQGDNWRQIMPIKKPKVKSIKITAHERSIKVVELE